MNRYVGQRSKKTGMAPGTLVHVGRHRTDTMTASILEYNETALNERKLEEPYDYSGALENGVKWINIDGIQDTAVLEKLGRDFSLHPLVLEDMLNTEQRPKLEDYGDYLYIVIRNLYIAGSGGGIETEHQSVLLGDGFVISVGEKENDFFRNVRERIVNGGRIRKLGADYLAYALLDTIVDYYFDVLESLGERIEKAEEKLVSKPDSNTLKNINGLKRDMLFLHRSIWPLREVAGLLERGDSRLVQDPTRVYIRDLYDHVIQSLDTTEIYRDILSGMLDIYLSSLSNRMNEIMKVLTVISTIFIPLTFLAGVYGMNFRFMPELGWRWGYPASLAVMAVIAAAMLAFFRRKKWL